MQTGQQNQKSKREPEDKNTWQEIGVISYDLKEEKWKCGISGHRYVTFNSVK